MDDQGAVFNLDTRGARVRRPRRRTALRPRAALVQLGPADRPRLAGRRRRRSCARATPSSGSSRRGSRRPSRSPQFPFLQNIERSAPSTTCGPPSCSPAGPRSRPSGSPPTPASARASSPRTASSASGYPQQWNVTLQRELGRKPRRRDRIRRARRAPTSASPTRTSTSSRSSSSPSATAPPARAEPLLRPDPRLFLDRRSHRHPRPAHARLSALHEREPLPQQRGQHDLPRAPGEAGEAVLEGPLVPRELHVFQADRRRASSVFDASILAGTGRELPGGGQPQPRPRARRLHRRHPARLRDELRLGPAVRARTGASSPAGSPGRLRTAGSSRAIATLQSGMPVPVTQVTNFNAFAGFGTQRPNRVADPALPSSERRRALVRHGRPSRSRRSSRSATARGTRCAAPATGTWTSPSSEADRPRPDRPRSSYGWRRSTSRTRRPSAPPNGVLGSPGFGSITAAGDPRVLQLGLKLHF